LTAVSLIPSYMDLDTPTPRLPKGLTELEREHALRLLSESHLAKLVDSFFRAWPTGTSSDSSSDCAERVLRFQSFEKLYSYLRADLDDDNFLESLPLDIAACLYSGCLANSRNFPPITDQSARQRWDLPVARVLSNFLDIFSDSDTD